MTPLEQRFPVDYIPPPAEAGKTYARNCANGFFRRYMSGDVVLDIGYKGYDNPKGITVLPHAIGVDLDYPGYDGKTLPFADGRSTRFIQVTALSISMPINTRCATGTGFSRLAGFLSALCRPSYFTSESGACRRSTTKTTSAFTLRRAS